MRTLLLGASSLNCCLIVSLAFMLSIDESASAEPVVPGTGRKIPQVGDDFEDVEWKFILNYPKSTYNLDKNQRLPSGQSTNGRWYEGMKRGTPDYVRRVATPANGLPGSKGALALRSLRTGIPGRPSFQQQQDDYIADVQSRLGGTISASRTPNVVTRVFLPPVDQWENRTGCHFAFRMALETTPTNQRRGFFSSPDPDDGIYWPGMFINFETKEGNGATGHEHDHAYINVRANSYGGDFKALQIKQTGWWTLGMSVTPDGMVHYYAKTGVEDLTADDHITSQYPYGNRALRFRTFFFNVCNGDDNKTWSTQWIIDDPAVYIVR